MTVLKAPDYRFASIIVRPHADSARWWLVLPTLLLALAHTPALADVAIDDFSTGVFTETLGVTGNLPWVGFQSGSMVGGSRAVAVETFDSIGEARPTTVAVTPAGAFEVQSGPGISHRINLIYGKTPNGDAPLALDLSNEDRIRIHFTHNNSPFNQINFNLTMYNGVSPYLQIGYNVPGSAVPFDWDFLFADGILGAPPGVTKFDFSDVSFMDFQAQGGQDWGIDNIFAVSVPEPGSAALMFAGLGLVGWFGAHRRARARTHGRAHRPHQPSSNSCGRP